MKRKLAVPAVILGIILLLSWWLAAHRELLAQSPLQKGLPIQNLSVMTSDAQGNLYIIVEARKKIIKLDKNGTSQYIIESADAGNRGELYLFSKLAVDHQGFLYVCCTDLDSTGIYVESESVLCYDQEGRLVKTLHRIDYQGNNRPLRAGNIKSLAVKGDTLCFTYLEANQAYLYTIRLKDYSAHKSIIAYLPEQSYVSDIIGTAPGAIYYSTQRGELYHINADGQSALIYPPQSYLDLAAYGTGLHQTPDRTFPVQMKLYQGKLYFIDTFANEIRALSGPNLQIANTVFSQANLGSEQSLSLLKDMVVGSDGTMSVAQRDRIYQLDAGGQLINTIDKTIQPAQTHRLVLLTWMMPLLILGLLIYMLRYIYNEIMERRVSLIVKQIAVFTPVMIIGMTFLSWFVYQQFADREEKEVYRQLVVLTRTGLNRINPVNLQNISSPRDYMNQDYSALRDLTIEAQINRGSGVHEDNLDQAGLYTAIYKLEQDRLYAIVDYDNSVNMYRPITIAGEFQRVLDTKEMVIDKASDENGSWMFAMAPIFDRNGNIIGIYESGVDRSGFNQERMALFKDIAKNIGFLTLAIILIFLLVTYFQLQSIRQLRNSVAEIAQGNWEVAVALETGDEVADLGASVNDMAAHIRAYIQEITDMSEAYYRFVPQQFLNLLGKQSIIDVELGDQVRQDMSIMSLNIHSFYQLSGTMSPEDNFNFIKSYLSWMGTIISGNYGLIDKYTGSGFLALFPEEADQAVQAAIELRDRLQEYNAGRKRAGYIPIDFGIGLHKGPLMLGVIGEAKRMAGTVISDNVNVATYLHLLTGKLACPIILTEDILQAMKNPHYYQYRCLGRLRSPEREEALQLYDVFDGEPDDIAVLKLETRELFEEGVALFQQGNFYEARSRFIDVIRRNRADEIARIYFYRCEEYEKNNPPQDWDGVLYI